MNGDRKITTAAVYKAMDTQISTMGAFYFYLFVSVCPGWQTKRGTCDPTLMRDFLDTTELQAVSFDDGKSNFIILNMAERLQPAYRSLEVDS